MTCTGNARRTGVFDLLGTTVSGWLSDRTNNRLLLFVYYGLRGLAPFYLPDGLAAEGTRLSIFAMFYGWVQLPLYRQQSLLQGTFLGPDHCRRRAAPLPLLDRSPYRPTQSPAEAVMC